MLGPTIHSNQALSLANQALENLRRPGRNSLTGIFNFAANLAGIVTPLVVSPIVAATGSFVGALVFIGVVALVGALSYIFIVGDIRRIVLVD
ncbi:sugar phosphate permease [Paraburkholderia sp. CI3]